ncbi:MAG TPA: NUDIX hydrolase [Methyloceanibacter sp.]|nr:NUDIX hydrolase [Methyloceanibacter sp.]
MKQVAALPFVDTPSGPLVLLITTRSMGRWTIPKGWTKAGLEDAEMAAREAFEEAGVEGEISPKPVGSYDYTKRLHLFSWTRCSVDVFGLRTRWQELDWPEKQSRTLRWVTPEKAAAMVRDAQLADVLRDFAKLGLT